jgi:hypothetical protein
MPEHVHFECSKFFNGAKQVVQTIVRRRYADREEAIYKELGYEISDRYCGDPVCLGPEPVSRLAP